MSAPVLLAARGPQEIELLQALEADRAFTVTRRCSDGPELVAAATAGVGQLAIIQAEFFPIDLDFLTSITITGCAVILVIDPTEQAQHAPLARVAAEKGIAVAADVTEALQAAHEWLATPAPAPSEAISDGAAHPAGNICAIWGPAGAPGRTSLAIEIASHLAAGGQRTLLVDADPYGGMVAPALGLLDEASGLIAATRAAGRGALSPEGLLEQAVGISATLRVLVGIPRADRWPELTPTALDHVWKTARASAQWVIIDCGFSLETDEELMFDTRAPQRNGATLSALAAADTVVAVGQGDPLGMPRLVRGIGELRETASPQRLLTAVTRVRSSVAGSGPHDSVQEILRRYAGVATAHTIPEDRAAFDAALLAGKSVLELAPDSAATKAIARLTADLNALNTRN